jgi:nucleoside 2-deoxyribosyltransferase
MKVYLAGPMRGYPEFNFPAFDAYRDALIKKGYEVISPADLDRKAGFDPSDVVTGELQREMITRDVQAICTCDALVLMPGWESSTGVKVEKALAEFLNLEVFKINEMNL